MNESNPRAQLTKMPEMPAACIGANLPSVARQFGYPDISDGVNNIASFEIQTPEEERICKTKFTADLRYFAESQEPLVPELHALIQTKIACGALTVREFAMLAFGVTNSKSLTQAALAHQKNNTAYLASTLVHADDYGLIELKTDASTPARRHNPKKHSGSAVSWQDKRVRINASTSHQDAFMWLFDIDPEAVSDKPVAPLSPIAALDSYVSAFGGEASRPASSDIARGVLQERYERDLNGKIFFPDPVNALYHSYGQRKMSWQTYRDRNVYHSVQLAIKSPTNSGLADVYNFDTVGPNRHASRQAAARLILDHLGATDLALLDN